MAYFRARDAANFVAESFDLPFTHSWDALYSSTQRSGGARQTLLWFGLIMLILQLAEVKFVALSDTIACLPVLVGISASCTRWSLSSCSPITGSSFASPFRPRPIFSCKRWSPEKRQVHRQRQIKLFSGSARVRRDSLRTFIMAGDSPGPVLAAGLSPLLPFDELSELI